MEKSGPSELNTKTPPARGFVYRWLRFGTKWGALIVVLLATLIYGSIWYLDHKGLPDFAKIKILEQLRTKGLELDFSSMRWTPKDGILVEEVVLVAPKDPNEPSFSADAVQVRLSPLQWFFQEVNIEEAIVRGGRLTMPVDSEMEKVEQFEAVNIETKVKLHSRQWWELEFLTTEMLGLEISCSGSVTNAYAFSEWSTGKSSPETPLKFGRLVKQIVETKERIQFSVPPEIRVHVDLDAKDPERSAAQIHIQSDLITTEFGELQGALLTAEIPSRDDQEDFWNVEWNLSWDAANLIAGIQSSAKLSGTVQLVTRTGEFRNALFAGTTEFEMPDRLMMEPVLLSGRLIAPEENELHWNTEATIVTDKVEWLQEHDIVLERSEWKGRFQWVPGSKTDWMGNIDLNVHGLDAPWVSIKSAGFTAQMAPQTKRSEAQGVDESWAWWASLAPYVIGLDATFAGVDGPLIEASEFETQLRWDAPALHIQKLIGSLYRGGLDLRGLLDIPSREATLEVTSDFDARQIRHLLSPNGQKWIDQYSWVDPPRLKATGGARLPAWTDAQPDWRGEVKPTMRIDGYFDVDQGGFRGVPVEKASSDIFFEDMIWRLPNLTIHRPEGVTRLGYECDARTQDYVWDVESIAQPKALKPLLNAAGQKVLSELEFEDPVEVKGKVWGRWHHLERTGAEAMLKTGRMSYRNQDCLSVEATGSFTNQFFKIFSPVIQREEGVVKAEALGIDASEGFITITNALSHVHPMAIAHAIGPATARTLEPYHFASAPKVTMSGLIPFDDIESADATFEVDGGPFSFWKFHVPNIRSRIRWDHEKLTIGNVHAPFYEGELDGEMRLHLHDSGGASFEMDADLRNVHLGPLMKDVVAETRESEGSLNGQLRITAAETGDWGSWQGYGKVDLREGRLWDTPLFGVFSRLMNAVSPGLGNSRAAHGKGDFTITDSLIETRNLEIKERTARLKYKGSVDFDGNLDARVEAELLRDTPMLGKVFSLALWPVSKLFEYRVTGSLGEPEIKPLYMVPKYLLVPFQSLNSMDDWLLSEDGLIPVQRLWKSRDKTEVSDQEKDRSEGQEASIKSN